MALKEAVSGLEIYKRARQFLSRNKKTRTYIMPSAFGVAFGLMAIILFFLAVGYSNNLIYLFVFFLISMAVSSVFITNKNVDGIELESVHSDFLFADEKGFLSLVFKNNQALEGWNFSVYFEKTKEKTEFSDVKAYEESRVQVSWLPKKRGSQILPRIILESTFPVGLLRAWKFFRKKNEVLVFPARRGEPDFPVDAFGADEISQSGLFRDHRSYQTSDSAMKVDWRASARRQELLVKNFEQPEKPSLKFSWESTRSIADFELRLSQLCLWVDLAEKAGHHYSLEMGSQKLDFGKGVLHWKRCLELLAHFSERNL